MSSITSAGTLPPCDVGEGTGAEGVLGRVSIGIVEERDPVSVRRFFEGIAGGDPGGGAGNASSTTP